MPFGTIPMPSTCSQQPIGWSRSSPEPACICAAALCEDVGRTDKDRYVSACGVDDQYVQVRLNSLDKRMRGLVPGRNDAHIARLQYCAYARFESINAASDQVRDEGA